MGARWHAPYCYASARVDGPNPELADETEANAAELERAGYRMQAVRARLLAAELRIGLGDIDGAERLLATIGPAVATSLLDEVATLRVRALVAHARDRRADARRAVNRGVRLLADHQVILGAIELRAHAAENSNDLARIGVRLAIDDHRPRELLAQLEATRRTVSLLPAARPPEDEVLAELLTELRVVAAQQRAAIEGGSPDGELGAAPAGAGRSHPRTPAACPGRRHRAATSPSTSPCDCSATAPSSSTPTSTDGCTPCRWSVGGPRCTTSGRSTVWSPTSTGAATPCTASTGPRGRRRREPRRRRRSACSPARSPSA